MYLHIPMLSIDEAALYHLDEVVDDFSGAGELSEVEEVVLLTTEVSTMKSSLEEGSK